MVKPMWPRVTRSHAGLANMASSNQGRLVTERLRAIRRYKQIMPANHSRQRGGMPEEVIPMSLALARQVATWLRTFSVICATCAPQFRIGADPGPRRALIRRLAEGGWEARSRWVFARPYHVDCNVLDHASI